MLSQDEMTALGFKSTSGFDSLWNGYDATATAT
jgi:hypothetical protein